MCEYLSLLSQPVLLFFTCVSVSSFISSQDTKCFTSLFAPEMFCFHALIAFNVAQLRGRTST